MTTSGDWHAATTGSATPDTEKLRRELQDAPRELVDWEASCLKNISDLLDSLDKARVRWESVGSDLSEARTRLQRVQEERDLLAESHTDADKARTEIKQMRDELEDVRRERDRTAEELVITKEQVESHLAEQAVGVASVKQELAGLKEELTGLTDRNRSLAASRDSLTLQLGTLKEEAVSTSEQLGILGEENEALEERLVERKGETEEWKRRHEALENSEQQMRRLMEKRDEELADTKGRLIEADLKLEEEREKRHAAERTAGSAEDLKRLQLKMNKLNKEHEQNLVMLFDQRTKATRLEEKLEESEDHERARVKKIISKIHKELDAAGAPAGNDASFGERIRSLKK